MAASFIPCEHAPIENKAISNDQVEVVIKHPHEDGVHYLSGSFMNLGIFIYYLSSSKALSKTDSLSSWNSANTL